MDTSKFQTMSACLCCNLQCSMFLEYSRLKRENEAQKKSILEFHGQLERSFFDILQQSHRFGSGKFLPQEDQKVLGEKLRAVSETISPRLEQEIGEQHEQSSPIFKLRSLPKDFPKKNEAQMLLRLPESNTFDIDNDCDEEVSNIQFDQQNKQVHSSTQQDFDSDETTFDDAPNRESLTPQSDKKYNDLLLEVNGALRCTTPNNVNHVGKNVLWPKSLFTGCNNLDSTDSLWSSAPLRPVENLLSYSQDFGGDLLATSTQLPHAERPVKLLSPELSQCLLQTVASPGELRPFEMEGIENKFCRLQKPLQPMENVHSYSQDFGGKLLVTSTQLPYADPLVQPLLPQFSDSPFKAVASPGEVVASRLVEREGTGNKFCRLPRPLLEPLKPVAPSGAGEVRYSSSKPAKKKGADSSFHRPPSRRTPPPDRYKFQHGPVRKQSERKQLKGWTCSQCCGFYNMCAEGSKDRVDALVQKVSKHRSRHGPRSRTPPGFWNPEFPTREEMEELARQRKELGIL